MSRLVEHADRMFARVDAVLEAIESGEDPRPAVRRIDQAAPWDVLKLGQAFVADTLKQERRAESPESEP